ncbi:MAG: serine hydrolase [Saprospiraceae bacterium]|nr:serine hydrolase [Saprospiraceae bacterium]
MKNVILNLAMVLILCQCRKGDIGHSEICQYQIPPGQNNHPKNALFQDIIDRYVARGLPGIAILVRDGHGTWAGSGGYAELSEKVPFLPCTISKVASITKMFNGTLCHLLAEDGVLGLDDKVDLYLSNVILKNVANSRGATIRQLMNHTTGIYDAITRTSFYLALLNNPDRYWTGEELIEFAYGKDPEFDLGTSCFYSNTNTLLLSLVITLQQADPIGKYSEKDC